MSYAFIVDARYDSADEDGKPSVRVTERDAEDMKLPRIGRIFGSEDGNELLAKKLRNGEGKRWRVAYDVDYAGQRVTHRLAYDGRYIETDDEDNSDAEFAPLDWARIDVGAVMIQYRIANGWETL